MAANPIEINYTGLVRDALSKYKAMPVVEIMSLLNIPDSDILAAVDQLRAEHSVTVVGEGLDQIVTFKPTRKKK